MITKEQFFGLRPGDTIRDVDEKSWIALSSPLLRGESVRVLTNNPTKAPTWISYDMSLECIKDETGARLEVLNGPEATIVGTA